MRTYIYIDGFNFYYGAVKDTPYKWLDFKALFSKLLNPTHDIRAIKYFTAIVSGKIDPDQPNRQKTFIRALQKHIPEISIHYGAFLSHTIFQPLAKAIDRQVFGKEIRFAQVIKTEEKGSDVNLAVHILHDAWLDLYDCAVVVSNDSDLAEAMRLVKEHHKKKIGLVIPGGRHPSQELRRYADFHKQIRGGLLAACQLPDPIPDTTIRKPDAWK